MWRFVVFLFLALGLVSCHPDRKYTVLTDTVADTRGWLGRSGRDTIKAGDELTLSTEGTQSSIMKSARNGLKYYVYNDSAFNVETHQTLSQDIAQYKQGHLLNRIKKGKMTTEERKTYEFMTVIALTVLLVMLIVWVILFNADKLTRTWTGILYLLISISSLAANCLYFKCSHVEHAGHGFLCYLFSVDEYGWLKTAFFWLACFVLSAANLVGYGVTLSLSKAWSGRELYSAVVFLALAVWTVVYLFSSNEYNDGFLWALLAIMFVHFIALAVQNYSIRASWLEMCYIYFYLWICLLPMVVMVLTSVLLLVAFVITCVVLKGAIWGMLFGEVPEEKKSSHEKACVHCFFYNRPEGYCSARGAHKREYDTDSASCSFYKDTSL